MKNATDRNADIIYFTEIGNEMLKYSYMLLKYNYPMSSVQQLKGFKGCTLTGSYFLSEEFIIYFLHPLFPYLSCANISERFRFLSGLAIAWLGPVLFCLDQCVAEDGT